MTARSRIIFSFQIGLIEASDSFLEKYLVQRLKLAVEFYVLAKSMLNYECFIFIEQGGCGRPFLRIFQRWWI